MADEQSLQTLRQCAGITNLSEADLRRSYLTHANFSHAVLRGARLRHAKILRANLEDVEWGNADFDYADLDFINKNIRDELEKRFRFVERELI